MPTNPIISQTAKLDMADPVKAYMAMEETKLTKNRTNITNLLY